MNILIIIPAHNEAEFISDTLNSLVQQTHLPTEIVVVNDNSTDTTEDVLKKFTAQYKFIKSVYLNSSELHEPGSKIIKAFNHGLKSSTLDKIDVICKFDADLIFPNNYIECLMQAFSEDSNLGIYGGFCSVYKNDTWQLEDLTNKEHLRGALKAYSIDCFQKIGGLKTEMGWDTIDELLCLYYGYRLETNSNLIVKHLKPTGGKYKSSLAKKFGRSLFQMRYDFGLAFISCLKLGYKRASLGFVLDSMYSYLISNQKNSPYLVDAKQGRFIRKLRWKGVREKLF